MISAAAATFVGRSIIKIIPVIGWGISAVVAAGITESVGWMIALDFARNAKTEWEKKHGFDEKSKTEFCKNDEPEQGEYPIEELMFNADNFISGKKIRSEHKDEFDELINDIEKIIDSLPNDHPLRKKYDELNLIIE